MRTRTAFLCSLLKCILLSSKYLTNALPHVNECNYCHQCHSETANTTAASASRRRTSQLSNFIDTKAVPDGEDVLPIHLRASSYRADFNDKVPKFSLPNCTECYGCNTQLSDMKDTSTFFDRTFTNEKGATSGWLFLAATNKTQGGVAVVKVYCMPLPKRPNARIPMCAPDTIMKNMRLLLGIQKIAEECGFTDIIPRIWVDKVDAIVPNVGYHVRWHGLWMEVAEGVSLENFLHKGSPTRFPASVILDLLHNKLNKTQVVRGAIFDLLTSQCDRHAQNIFVNEAGQLKLIDNEAALQNSWKNCGFDSILVPTTQKHNIVRFSNQFILKLVTAADAPHGNADPQILLDYRCYLPDGKEEIGTDFPPQIQQCLTRISSMSVQEVKEHYGFVEDLVAKNLKTRATDMVSHGFEYAYKYGEPKNADPKRYRVAPKCCQINLDGQGRYRCGHAWEPKFELPIGDPVTGREWIKPRPDTGTYQGGTF